MGEKWNTFGKGIPDRNNMNLKDRLSKKVIPESTLCFNKSIEFKSYM